MSTIQPIPQIVERFGDTTPPEVVSAYRPEANGFGRRTGWIRTSVVVRLQVSRSILRSLKDQGFTKVRLQGSGSDASFSIEELLG